MIGKNELYFAKRDLEFCPVGMAAFILLFLLLIFPAGFRSYDWVPHIGVISSSQTCLSAGPDNCTEREAGREGEENRSGRKIQTDRPVIYSHLLRSFSLIWRVFINGRTRLWLLFHSWTTVAGVNVPSTCLLKLNIWTWNKMLCGQIWCILISRVRFNNRVIYSLLKSNVSYWPWNHLTLFDFQIVK